MKEADDLLYDLKKSREDLLEYKNNIEQQLQESQEIINIALKQDLDGKERPLTEQDAVWHGYLLKIFIDIKNNLGLIDSAIAQYEKDNEKGAVSIERTL